MRRFAFLNPRVKSLMRGNVLVLGSIALALELSGAPHVRQQPWLVLPLVLGLVGMADTMRNIGPRWNFRHAGVLLFLYMDLMAIFLVLFLLVYPYMNLGVR
jgi:hypothetical protein